LRRLIKKRWIAAGLFLRVVRAQINDDVQRADHCTVAIKIV
jgi:hypothetical protein